MSYDKRQGMKVKCSHCGRIVKLSTWESNRIKSINLVAKYDATGIEATNPDSFFDHVYQDMLKKSKASKNRL